MTNYYALFYDEVVSDFPNQRLPFREQHLRLVGEDVTFPPEALLFVRHVQGLEDSFLDRQVRHDDKHPSFRDPEGRDGRDT